MSLVTRVTHEAAKRLLDPQQYVTSMPCAANEDRPIVYLTFDDGPHPQHTHHILDHLASHGCRATFFMVGDQARRHPDTVRRVLREGHSIGSHTWSHTSVRGKSAHDYIEDVHRGRIELEQITGRRIDLFRPPYGELTPLTLTLLMWQGFRLIHWSDDPRDFEQESASSLTRQFAQRAPNHGDVVLMHDDRSVTSDAIDGILDAWLSRAIFHAIPMRHKAKFSATTLSPATEPNDALQNMGHTGSAADWSPR